MSEQIKASELPNSCFPDFLFNPVINEFTDYDIYNNYLFGADETTWDPRAAELKNITRKMRNPYHFIDAIEKYYSYIEDLAEKYGSVEIVLEAGRNGLIPEGVPPKPRLKGKRMRTMLEHGIVPTQRMDIARPTEETINVAFDFYNDIMDSLTDSDIEAINKIQEDLDIGWAGDKKQRKTIRRSLESISGKQRVANLYNKQAGNNQMMTFMSNLLASQLDHRIEIGAANDDDNPISNMNKEQEMRESTPTWRLELEETSFKPTQYVGGRFINQADVNRRKVHEALFKSGWDPLTIYKGSLKKKERYLIEEELGKKIPGTKDSKKNKKREEKLVRQYLNDQSTLSSVLSNSINLEDDECFDELDMTYASLGKRRGE